MWTELKWKMAFIYMYWLLIAPNQEARLENDQNMCGWSSGPPVTKWIEGQGHGQWSGKGHAREERARQDPTAWEFRRKNYINKLGSEAGNGHRQRTGCSEEDLGAKKTLQREWGQEALVSSPERILPAKRVQPQLSFILVCPFVRHFCLHS